MFKTVVLLLSGGLDSVTLAHDLRDGGYPVHAVLVDYKQPHVQELVWAKEHCKRLRILYTTLEIPVLGGLSPGNWVIPNRNAILISLAVNVAILAKADMVAIGCNADDAEMFPDCRRPFLDAMNAAVRSAGYAIEVCAPYLDMTKKAIARKATRFGIQRWSTWSCYRGGPQPCGECPACHKLAEACA